MTTRLPFLLWIALLAFLGAGCENVRDISSDKRYPTDYAVGDVYRTKIPLHFQNGALFSHGRMIDDRGELPVGSTLRVSRIELHSGFELGRLMVITARIEDGHFAGEQAEIWTISRQVVQSRPKATVVSVDTNVLERVSRL